MSRISPPAPPEPYVPYPPSTASPFVNRERELHLLNTWADPTTFDAVLTIVGVGGMGKTALAWEWFTKHLDSLHDFQGRMWWSFYEDDPEEFFLHCDAYIRGATASPQTPQRELVSRIARLLDAGRFLLVLDGVERQMLAYSPPA